MTTNEFIKAVKELGYEAEIEDELIVIIYKNKTLACIFTKELYRMSSYFPEIDCVKNAGILFALIFQYAVTPIEDREDKEKKYYLRHKWMRSGDFKFLYFDKDFKIYGLTSIRFKEVKTEYTEKEIEEIKEKFNTDLSDFEMIEVRDESQDFDCIQR